MYKRIYSEILEILTQSYLLRQDYKVPNTKDSSKGEVFSKKGVFYLLLEMEQRKKEIEKATPEKLVETSISMLRSLDQGVTWN